MVTPGVIVKIDKSNNNSYNNCSVYIPLFEDAISTTNNKMWSDAFVNGLKNHNLTAEYNSKTVKAIQAYLSLPPGLNLMYEVGDYVWVAFERDLANLPVVIGKIQNRSIDDDNGGFVTDTNGNTSFKVNTDMQGQNITGTLISATEGVTVGSTTIGSDSIQTGTITAKEMNLNGQNVSSILNTLSTMFSLGSTAGTYGSNATQSTSTSNSVVSNTRTPTLKSFILDVTEYTDGGVFEDTTSGKYIQKIPELTQQKQHYIYITLPVSEAELLTSLGVNTNTGVITPDKFRSFIKSKNFGTTLIKSQADISSPSWNWNSVPSGSKTEYNPSTNTEIYTSASTVTDIKNFTSNEIYFTLVTDFTDGYFNVDRVKSKNLRTTNFTTSYKVDSNIKTNTETHVTYDLNKLAFLWYNGKLHQALSSTTKAIDTVLKATCVNFTDNLQPDEVRIVVDTTKNEIKLNNNHTDVKNAYELNITNEVNTSKIFKLMKVNNVICEEYLTSGISNTTDSNNTDTSVSTTKTGSNGSVFPVV